MAYDGHIICAKCLRVLYLGKYKEGRFWPGKVSQEQFAIGVLRFLSDHFGHGDVVVCGDDRYERYLESCPPNEWPVTLFIEAEEDGTVRLVDQEWSRRG